MAPPLSITIDLTPLLGMVNALEARASDLRPVFHDEIVTLIYDFFNRQFDSQGRHGGAPWLDLRPTTIKLRKIMGKPVKAGLHAVLQNELRLRRSLTVRGAVDGVLNVSKTQMEVGTVRRGARQQQQGWVLRNVYRRRVAPRFIPPRQLVPEQMPTPFLETLERVVARHLEGG